MEFIPNLTKSFYSLICECYDWIKFKRICQLDADDWCIVCPAGIGDTYFICGLAQEFINKHEGAAFVVVVKKHHEEIPKLFPSVTRIIAVESIPVSAIMKFSSFKKGQPIYGHFGDTSIMYLLGVKDIHLLDLYRALLRLPATANLSKPRYSTSKALDNVKSLFSEKNLQVNKTLILAPKANSANEIDGIFWESVANRAIKLGWSVCTNTTNDEKAIKGTIPLNFTLEEAIAISELAGWVISIRSGFCDLISSAKTRLTIIYPEQNWYGGTVQSCSSLLDMKLSDSAEEYVFNFENYIDIIDSIFEMSKKRKQN